MRKRTGSPGRPPFVQLGNGTDVVLVESTGGKVHVGRDDGTETPMCHNSRRTVFASRSPAPTCRRCIAALPAALTATDRFAEDVVIAEALQAVSVYGGATLLGIAAGRTDDAASRIGQHASAMYSYPVDVAVHDQSGDASSITVGRDASGAPVGPTFRWPWTPDNPTA